MCRNVWPTIKNKKQLTEIESEMAQVLELSDKDVKKSYYK